MNIFRLRFFTALALSALVLLVCVPALAQASNETSQTGSVAAPPACTRLPPGRHLQLERMRDLFGLSCDQELRIEPLLHNEESVSKPLLRFTGFSPEEKTAVMLKIKIAARRQIRTLLTPDQQQMMDQEIESLANGQGGAGGAKKPKDSDAKADAFENEEALSLAILNYSALTPEEQKAMAVEVKTAARRNEPSQLTADQLAKLDADIRQLSTGKKM